MRRGNSAGAHSLKEALMFFALRATLSDGFTVDLAGRYASQEAASREAARYMRDYRNPCGMNVTVAYVSIIDTRLLEREAA